MISVTRGPALVELVGPQAQNLLHQLRSFYEQPESVRQQSRPPLDKVASFLAQLRPQLESAFKHKCVYCESPLYGGDAEIEQFRPKLGASDLDGKGSLDHYGWLSLEWENLYVACPKCNRNKRSFFPVESKRAPPLSSMAEVRRIERPMLIDPCDNRPGERPEEHLEFVESGEVRPRTPRGEATIKILQLNREHLVKARHGIATKDRASGQRNIWNSSNLARSARGLHAHCGLPDAEARVMGGGGLRPGKRAHLRGALTGQPPHRILYHHTEPPAGSPERSGGNPNGLGTRFDVLRICRQVPPKEVFGHVHRVALIGRVVPTVGIWSPCRIRGCE